jgi:hypothetical protein
MSIDGGWTVHDSITEEDINVFNTAKNGLVGVDYKPEMVATQVVAGTNYCFICKATIVIPDAPEGISKVMIFKPLEGNPVITSIEKIL